MSPATAEPQPDPLFGQLFAGRYRIHGLIARGAMGRVYRAEHETLGRVLAIKVLSLASRPDTAADHARFSHEASQLARLTHPNTVRVYDHGVERGLSYIVMEFVPGGTLREILADGPLDPLRTLRIARQICGSLGEAHALGLIHRDLKPANIMVTRTAEGEDLVKVVDLGLVKEFAEAAHRTAEGELVGTPMCMAPEQIRGEALDPRVDVYALGVLLYRCFTGAAPFPQEGAAPILLAHLHEPPRPFSAVAPDLALPRAIEWMVQRCLEKDPNARFATMRELVRALALCEASLLDEGTVSFDRVGLVHGRLVVGPRQQETPTGRARRLGWPLVAATAAALLVLAAAVGFNLVHTLASPSTMAPPVAQPVAQPEARPEARPEAQPVAQPEAQPEAPHAARSEAPVASLGAAPVPPPGPEPVSSPPPDTLDAAQAPNDEPPSSDLLDPWADGRGTP